MKKLFILGIAAIGCLLFIQGKSQTASGSPSDAAVNFTKCFLTFHIKDAEKYMTKTSAESLDQFAALIESQTASIPDSVKTILAAAKIVASNEKISGDSATVDVTTTLDRSFAGSNQETKNLSLAKENGEWKVVFDIAKLMGGGSSEEDTSNNK